MRVLSVIIFCGILSYIYGDGVDDDQPFRGQRSVEFDWKFVKTVFGAHKSNAVISPLSVKMMLVILYEATGPGPSITQTKQELRTVLEPTGDIEATRNKYRQWLDSATTSHKDYELQIATKYYVEDYIDIISKYQIIVDYYYNTSDEQVPFSKPQLAAERINNWVKQSTHDRISEVVTAAEVEGVVIALLNVISFKGVWTYPFPENGPMLTFYTRQKQIQTQFMEQSGQFYYDDSVALDAQLLRLSYRGGKFAMYFLLPHQGKTVEDVLDKITPTTLRQALWYMDETEVNVTIPKFKFDFSKELIQPLKDAGVRDLFSDSASFPLLARGKGARNEVRPSRLFQKVGISINEQGSEAYAATGTQVVNKFGGDGIQIFTANRPFLFFIEDEDFGTLHFAGRVEDPTV